MSRPHQVLSEDASTSFESFRDQIEIVMFKTKTGAFAISLPTYVFNLAQINSYKIFLKN